jgi:uncharacterized protein YacL
VTDDRRGSAPVIVELFRLGIVLVLTAAGFSLGPTIDRLLQRGEADETRLIASVLGALFGYLVGGVIGRRLVSGVDSVQERLRRVEAAVLVSAAAGATLGAFFALMLLSPVLLLPGRQFTIPIATLVVLGFTYAGGRLGAARAGDLIRFVGVRGRLEVTSPSRGVGVKIADSSALVDGRLVDVARAGFLEGTLVVPRFVLLELQGLADAEDRRKRGAGRRGLDALTTLQDEHLVAVEVTDDDVPDVAAVDAKLAALCRQRHAALVTVDGNLARVAEIGGVKVLNLHVLAEALRPPAVPGDRIRVQIVKEGTEPRQGVGYLADGSMVVVERADDAIGAPVDADVTSVMQNRQGRMLFASRAEGDR